MPPVATAAVQQEYAPSSDAGLREVSSQQQVEPDPGAAPPGAGASDIMSDLEQNLPVEPQPNAAELLAYEVADLEKAVEFATKLNKESSHLRSEVEKRQDKPDKLEKLLQGEERKVETKDNKLDKEAVGSKVQGRLEKHAGANERKTLEEIEKTRGGIEREYTIFVGAREALRVKMNGEIVPAERRASDRLTEIEAIMSRNSNPLSDVQVSDGLRQSPWAHERKPLQPLGRPPTEKELAVRKAELNTQLTTVTSLINGDISTCEKAAPGSGVRIKAILDRRGEVITKQDEEKERQALPKDAEASMNRRKTEVTSARHRAEYLLSGEREKLTDATKLWEDYKREVGYKP